LQSYTELVSSKSNRSNYCLPHGNLYG
jgi:hypothetical protein